MKRIYWPVFLPLVLLLSACQTSQEPEATATTEADVATLTDLIAQYDTAVNDRDVDAFLAYYAEDAVRMIPNQPVLIGKASFQEQSIEDFSNEVEELHSTIEEMQIVGDWAWMRLSYTDTYTSPDSESPIDEVGKWLIRFKKQQDGDWKIASEIWNVDTPRN